jgi:ABC-2 type transport system permease protein
MLSALSTSFALFFTSILEREISLAASGVYVITSILAGSFYSFTDNNKIFDAICSIIPQKAYMTMVDGIEKGSSILDYKVQIMYLLVCIIGFWLVGSSVTKKKIKIS